MPRPTPPGWFPRRGEVYWVRLGGRKTRPAVILSIDALNRHALDVCVIPITTVHHAEFSLRVPVQAPDGGLDRDSWVKCDQVHTVPKRDLLHPPLGRLSADALRQVEAAVRTSLQL